MIKHVIWSSMIDYPGHISTVLFTDKCNFNCSYCYNKSLSKLEDKCFEKEILSKLIERKDFINHIIISGGEPTIDENFESIIELLNENGFIIGIHTNGSNPEKVMANINKINYIGIDIKSITRKYNEVSGAKVNVEDVKKLIKDVIKSGKKYELRTTLFPKYVSKEDVVQIAKWLKSVGANKYHLQQFYAVNGAEQIDSYTEQELNEICEECNKIIPTTLKSK